MRGDFVRIKQSSQLPVQLQSMELCLCPEKLSEFGGLSQLSVDELSSLHCIILLVVQSIYALLWTSKQISE